MSKDQDWHNELSAFEAALAALTPRGDGLNREHLIFLAGQASARSREEGQVRSSGTRRHRWGWQAAFAAMTTVAAGLLVTLAVRPPRVVERIVTVPAAPSDAAIAREDRHERNAPSEDEMMTASPRRAVERSDDWMSFFWASFQNQPSGSLSVTASSRNLQLRNLAFSRGLGAWPTPPALAVEGSGVSPRSRPACQRELLDELLKRPEGHRLGLPEADPESTSHPGAKS